MLLFVNEKGEREVMKGNEKGGQKWFHREKKKSICGRERKELLDINYYFWEKEKEEKKPCFPPLSIDIFCFCWYLMF